MKLDKLIENERFTGTRDKGSEMNFLKTLKEINSQEFNIQQNYSP